MKTKAIITDRIPQFISTSIILFFLLFIDSSTIQAQCNVTITSSSLTVPCGGGPVTLTAIGTGATTQVLNEDFNNGTVGAGWSVSAAGMFTNPCGPSYDGSTHMWMGQTTAAPRTMQTAAFDLSCGGNVCFYLKFATQGGTGDCEGPDVVATEGVFFEYSIDGGATWVTINYFAPNTGGAAGAITNWAQYCFPIPAGAMTTNTLFHWYQGGSSGTCCDHWGIDDVTISSQNCGSVWYDWAHVAGTVGPTGDPAVQNVNVTSDSTFTVCYTDGAGFNCCESVTINVLGMNAPTFVAVDETCTGDNDGSITLTEGAGGIGPYTYAINGPSNQSNGTGIFNGLPPGAYVGTVTDNGSACAATVNITILAGTNCCTMTNTEAFTNVVCNGACDGTITLTASTPIGAVLYSIDNGVTTQASGTFINLCPATYDIWIQDGTGVTCLYTSTIMISEPLAVQSSFTFTNECFGTVTGFTDLSNPNGGTITNWDWDFNNDGNVDDVSQNTTNGYAAAGSYTVELLVTTALGCKDSITLQIVVNPIPVADFSVADVCFGATSMFNDLSNVANGNIIDWQWNFGDGVGNSAVQNPTYNYTTAGVYPVTLTITSDSGCINTYVDNAGAYFLPTAAFTINNVCSNVAASFTDLSNPNGGVINSWSWDFDGNGTTDDTNQNPSNLYASDGTYNVQLIVSSASGCADTIVQPIDIYPMPIANFSFVNACFGTAITFNNLSNVSSGNISNWDWDFGNSNTSINQNPSENYGSEGIYNTQLIVTTNNGCQDMVSQNIEVWPIPVVNFTPNEVCLNAATQFNDLTTISNLNTSNTIVQWTWDFGDGVGVSNLQNPIYAYTMDGVFTANLNVVSNNGCTNNANINVTVNPLPEVIFGNPTAGCGPNLCVNFVNNSTINTTSQPTATISNWAWNFGDGETSSSMNPSYCYQNSSYSVLQNFDVTLTAISDKQCTTTVVEPAMVTVYPKPLADFSYSPKPTDIYDKEITFTDNSQYASVWLWDFGDGNGSTSSGPMHEYADSGSYFVSLYMENQYGCKDTISRTVKIDPVYAIFIPNSFTPNGDDINDYFFTKGFGINELQTLIFNRWGTVVYEGYLVDSKWDGSYKGSVIQEDVFVYKIRARDVFNEWHEYIGRVTIIK